MKTLIVSLNIALWLSLGFVAVALTLVFFPPHNGVCP